MTLEALEREIIQLKTNIDKANANFLSLDIMYRDAVQKQHQYHAELLLRDATIQKLQAEIEALKQPNPSPQIIE